MAAAGSNIPGSHDLPENLQIHLAGEPAPEQHVKVENGRLVIAGKECIVKKGGVEVKNEDALRALADTLNSTISQSALKSGIQQNRMWKLTEKGVQVLKRDYTPVAIGGKVKFEATGIGLARVKEKQQKKEEFKAGFENFLQVAKETADVGERAISRQSGASTKAADEESEAPESTSRRRGPPYDLAEPGELDEQPQGQSAAVPDDLPPLPTPPDTEVPLVPVRPPPPPPPRNPDVPVQLVEVGSDNSAQRQPEQSQPAEVAPDGAGHVQDLGDVVIHHEEPAHVNAAEERPAEAPQGQSELSDEHRKLAGTLGSLSALGLEVSNELDRESEEPQQVAAGPAGAEDTHDDRDVAIHHEQPAHTEVSEEPAPEIPQGEPELTDEHRKLAGTLGSLSALGLEVSNELDRESEEPQQVAAGPAGAEDTHDDRDVAIHHEQPAHTEVSEEPAPEIPQGEPELTDEHRKLAGTLAGLGGLGMDEDGNVEEVQHADVPITEAQTRLVARENSLLQDIQMLANGARKAAQVVARTGLLADELQILQRLTHALDDLERVKAEYMPDSHLINPEGLLQLLKSPEFARFGAMLAEFDASFFKISDAIEQTRSINAEGQQAKNLIELRKLPNNELRQVVLFHTVLNNALEDLIKLSDGEMKATYTQCSKEVKATSAMINEAIGAKKFLTELADPNKRLTMDEAGKLYTTEKKGLKWSSTQADVSPKALESFVKLIENVQRAGVSLGEGSLRNLLDRSSFKEALSQSGNQALFTRVYDEHGGFLAAEARIKRIGLPSGGG